MLTRFTHLVRRLTARATLVFVALALALLPGVMPAFARAQRIPLDGTETKNFGVPDRAWNAGPWAFHHGTLLGTFDFGELAGTLVWVATDRFDFSTGNGFVHGQVTYTDTDSGVICSGSGEGKVTGFFLTAHIVAQCSDGSHMKGTLQDVFNDLVGLHSTFHGELLIP